MKTIRGKISTFGGPADTGVSPSEGLAYIEHPDLADPFFTDLFLPAQPPRTTGLARRLNPARYYLALRMDNAHSGGRERVRRLLYTVTGKAGKRIDGVKLADWGPNNRTDRVMDMSPGLAKALGLATDDYAELQILDDVFINA